MCGAVSGNLEGIDIDNKPQPGHADATALFEQVRALVEADAPGLWSRLVIDRSPNGGYHLAYRCATIARNGKLAQRPATDAERAQAKNGKLDRVTVIETRGEGGYLISAPSPGYERLQGDLAEPPLLTSDERTILFNAARSLNTFVPSTRIVGQVASTNGTKPGADYNARTTIDDVQGVLLAANWTVVRSSGNACMYLRRPGKDDSWSATLGHAGTNLLYVFSSNATPFEPDTAYTPFAVYTLLEHDGDFAAAARALVQQGYGAPEQPTIDTAGSASCPDGHGRLVRSTNGNGWRCPAQCGFWWQGDGYTAPIPSNGHVRSLQPQATPTTPVPQRRWLTEDEVDQIAPPTWLVKGVIPLGEVTMVAGAGDAGKTFLVVDMTKRVAQHYRTMYVAAEDAAGIKVRKQAWELHHKLPKNGNFLMWNGVLPLYDTLNVTQFIDEVRGLGLKMLVIDTLSQSITGADENSAADMSVVMANCQRIAHELGVAVVIIHHTTKDGSNYRGSSVMKNNTYGFLDVSLDDDLIRFECTRIKNTKPFDPRFFRLVEVTTTIADEAGVPIRSCVILPADRVVRNSNELTQAQRKMLETLLLMTEAQGGAKTTELQSALGLNGNSFYAPLRALRSLGLVDKGDKHTDPLVVNTQGRARLAQLSNHPDYQQAATATSTQPIFEVNTLLGEMLPSYHGSNSDGSNGGSNGANGNGAAFLPNEHGSNGNGAQRHSSNGANEHVPEMLPSYHGSNADGSNAGSNHDSSANGPELLPNHHGSNSVESNGSQGSYYHNATNEKPSRNAVTTNATKILPDPFGSIGDNTTTTAGSLDRQVGSNSEINRERKHGATGVSIPSLTRNLRPVINQDKIRLVLDKLNVRGPTWAREFMDRVEGFAYWPQHVQAAVQAAEREALE